ncbi:MAG: hypothetical protein WCP97_00635 [bacterium]
MQLRNRISQVMMHLAEEDPRTDGLSKEERVFGIIYGTTRGRGGDEKYNELKQQISRECEGDSELYERAMRSLAQWLGI